MFLLPSKGRPERLKVFFEHYWKTNSITPGYVLVNENDPSFVEYTKVIMPENWVLYSINHVGKPSIGKANKIWMHEHFVKNKTGFIGLLSDDYFPKTKHWDARLIGGLADFDIISANDLFKAPNRMGCCVFSYDIIQAVGYLYPPGINHMYFDDVWENIGMATDTWKVRMDTIVEHDHWEKNKDLYDETAKHTCGFFKSDKKVYEKWFKNDFQKVLTRVRTMLKNRYTPKKGKK
jgi:hypothetical protein